MKVAFQGVLGAYSHQAAQNIYPDAEYIGCETFAKVLELTAAGVADRAVVQGFVRAIGERVSGFDELVSPAGLVTLATTGVECGVDVARLLASHYPNTYIAWLDATTAEDLRIE